MSFTPQDKLYRSSPLGAACRYNHLQVAQLLIDNDADIDYQEIVFNNTITINALSI